jgi:hypothetical protein
MNLDEGQRKQVSEWITQGLKLSEIQNRLASELGIRLTYMDVRLLVDDLKLTPKDVERAKPADAVLQAAAAAKSPAAKAPSKQPSARTPAAPPAPTGGVTLAVDTLARPGAVASGKVTFSDGQTAEWYFDQMGRLGLVPPSPGYRPSQEDVQDFQQALDRELSKLGM